MRVLKFVPLFPTLALAASAVLDLIPSNFEKVVTKSGKPALVEFFAPWCGHCKNLAPIYEELGHAFAHAADKVVIGKVDADEHKDLGRKFGVQGFPTLKWFDGKGGEPQDYSGGRDLESLSAWITDKTGIRSKASKKPPSSVVMLDEKSFQEKVGGDQNVLVAFTAPWCGHCKSLAPVWEGLASTFAPELNVLVAKVDCEAPNAKSLAQDFDVKGFPTIKFFPKGSKKPIDYDGARAEQDFADYLNEKAGTFRLPGGGLNSAAGTIGSLDKIISKGGDAVYDSVQKAATSLKDATASYYAKVAKKLAANKEYADKEFKRLQGMLKKGGLAPEKIDDLTTRSNILQKFHIESEDKSEL